MTRKKEDDRFFAVDMAVGRGVPIIGKGYRIAGTAILEGLQGVSKLPIANQLFFWLVTIAGLASPFVCWWLFSVLFMK